jgi:hypothetical protein
MKTRVPPISRIVSREPMGWASTPTIQEKASPAPGLGLPIDAPSLPSSRRARSA